ncbi:MAG: hypothetical protein ACI8PZ_001159 [Myxococcota bacterium]|jgi:hypothetical protein
MTTRAVTSALLTALAVTACRPPLASSSLGVGLHTRAAITDSVALQRAVQHLWEHGNALLTVECVHPQWEADTGAGLHAPHRIATVAPGSAPAYEAPWSVTDASGNTDPALIEAGTAADQRARYAAIESRYALHLVPTHVRAPSGDYVPVAPGLGSSVVLEDRRDTVWGIVNEILTQVSETTGHRWVVGVADPDVLLGSTTTTLGTAPVTARAALEHVGVQLGGRLVWSVLCKGTTPTPTHVLRVKLFRGSKAEAEDVGTPVKGEGLQEDAWENQRYDRR